MVYVQGKTRGVRSTMKHLLKLTTGILLLTGIFPVQAQFRAPGGLPPGFHHAILDALADGPAFYGRAKVHLSNGPDKDPTTISCDIAVSSGKMRLEADSFEPGANLPPTEAANVKQMHSITILRPDKNRMYLVFPSVNSYVELAYSKATGTDATPPATINKTPLPKESIGDTPCDKSLWDVTESNGEHYDITVWTATNLSSIPIQIKVGAPAALVEFENLHIEAPDSGIFEPPAGYTKYEGIQELIQRDNNKAQNAPSP
jgi:hypothetical protein